MLMPGGGFFMKIDQVMLREMIGSESAGIYAAATRISEIWYFVPIIIVSSVSPAIVDAKKIGEDIYYRRLRKLFQFTAGLAFAIAIPTTVLSKYFVLLLFGKSYEAAGPILAVHIWAALFYFFGDCTRPVERYRGAYELIAEKNVDYGRRKYCPQFYTYPCLFGYWRCNFNGSGILLRRIFSKRD